MDYIVKRQDGKDNSNEEYLVLRLDNGFKHSDASYKALKKYVETIAITDKELYDELNMKYDLRCEPINGNALLSYIHQKMSQDDFMFDCIGNLMEAVDEKLNKQIDRLNYSNHKITKKPLQNSFLKLKNI